MKPWNRILLFAAVLGLALSAAVPGWLDPEPPVFDAVLNPLHDFEFAAVSSPSTCDIEGKHLDGVSAALRSAFLAANAVDVPQGRVSDQSSTFSVGNSTQVAALGSLGIAPIKAGAKHLVVAHLSRVGFDATRSEALFCMRTSHGSTMFHLRRVAGLWQIFRDHPLSTVFQPRGELRPRATVNRDVDGLPLNVRRFPFSPGGDPILAAASESLGPEHDRLRSHRILRDRGDA